MKIDAALFEKAASYSHVIVTWTDDDGYPLQTPATFTVDADRGEVLIGATGMPLPGDRDVNVTMSHIRPQPGTGYDQRRYIELWGRASVARRRATRCRRPAPGAGTRRRRRSSSIRSARTNRRAATSRISPSRRAAR